MIVSKELLDEEIRKITYEGDSNYIFLKQISGYWKEIKRFDYSIYEETIRKVQVKAKDLDIIELQEWKQTVFLKIQLLFKKIQYIIHNKTINITCSSNQLANYKKSLREAFHLLVVVCISEQIEYNKEEIENLIKEFYYEEYGNDVMPYFLFANYDVSGYDIIYYPRKTLTFACCAQENPSQNK